MGTRRARSWLLLEWTGTVLFGLLPDTRAVNAAISKLFYAAYNGWRAPNLVRPERFNEKLVALKLSGEADHDQSRRVTDKELVKQHVTALLGEGHVVPTLAVLRSAAEVDSFAFPLPCVVKPTHSSQEVLHLDAAQPTPDERRRMKYWLWKSYFAANREPNYRGLEHKLIVEPVIGGAFGAIEDVKVLCFGGRPKLIQVDEGRFGRHVRDYYDIRGERLPVTMRKPAGELPFRFAAVLPELLSIAARLSDGYRFLRVDCYIVGTDILIGELTQFPTNCTVPFRPETADRIIARLFDEPDLDLTPELLAAAEGLARLAEPSLA